MAHGIRSITAIRKAINACEVNLAAQELKSTELNSERDLAATEYQRAKELYEVANYKSQAHAKTISGISKQLNSLVAERDSMQKRIDTSPMVTDHAVIRYIEKVLGIDVDAIRREITADGRDQTIKYMDDGRVSVSGKYTLVIANHKVVTVIIEENHD